MNHLSGLEPKQYSRKQVFQRSNFPEFSMSFLSKLLNESSSCNNNTESFSMSNCSSTVSINPTYLGKPNDTLTRSLMRTVNTFPTRISTCNFNDYKYHHKLANESQLNNMSNRDRDTKYNDMLRLKSIYRNPDQLIQQQQHYIRHHSYDSNCAFTNKDIALSYSEGLPSSASNLALKIIKLRRPETPQADLHVIPSDREDMQKVTCHNKFVFIRQKKGKALYEMSLINEDRNPTKDMFRVMQKLEINGRRKIKYVKVN